MTLHLTGIYLQLKSHRESDFLLTFYSREKGKATILVKGGAKIKSKLVGLCQPFTLLDLVVAPGKSIYHLTGGQSKKVWKKIGRDLEKIKTGAYFLRLLDKLTQPEVKDQKIYGLMMKTFSYLDRGKIKIKLLSLAYTLKLLSLSGYQPQIKQCLKCGKKKIKTPLYFSFEQGGLVCGQCSPGENYVSISPSLLKLLHHLLYKKYEQLKNLKVANKDLQEGEELIKQFLIWQTS